MQHSFNLVTKPWLPVRFQNGHFREVSLRDVLLQAHDIKQLEDPSPLVLAALHRFLLAVLHRVLEGPSGIGETTSTLQKGQFPTEKIEGYLGRWIQHFDLFDPSRPFYQVSDFELDESKRAPISRLAPELASGNNALLFDHSVDENPEPREGAECSRWLITHQTFALGGGRSPFKYTKHAPIATFAMIIPLGNSLFETLCFNLVPYPPEEREWDAPVWEEMPPSQAVLKAGPERVARGRTDKYTWLSRTLLLHPEGPNERPFVKLVSYASGVGLKGDAGINWWLDDPMVAYREDPKRGVLALALRPGRAFWRDFSALVPAPESKHGYRQPSSIENAQEVLERTDRDLPLRVAVYAQANKQAKLELWRAEAYPLPHSALGDSGRRIVEVCLQAAEDAGAALNRSARVLATKLLTTNDDRTPDPRQVADLVNTFPTNPKYWASLELAFTELIGKLSEPAEDAYDWWCNQVRHAAWEALKHAVSTSGTRASAFRAGNLAKRSLARSLNKLFGETAPAHTE